MFSFKTLRYLRLNIVLAHSRFIIHTFLCLKAKYVTCIKGVTAGRLGTKHFRFTVYKRIRTATKLDSAAKKR